MAAVVRVIVLVLRIEISVLGTRCGRCEEEPRRGHLGAVETRLEKMWCLLLVIRAALSREVWSRARRREAWDRGLREDALSPRVREKRRDLKGRGEACSDKKEREGAANKKRCVSQHTPTPHSIMGREYILKEREKERRKKNAPWHLRSHYPVSTLHQCVLKR
jgi:hypothetical protein